jgi:hypothetical protein
MISTVYLAEKSLLGTLRLSVIEASLCPLIDALIIGYF